MRSIILGTHIVIEFLFVFLMVIVFVFVFSFTYVCISYGIQLPLKGEILFLAITFVVPSNHSMVGRTQALYLYLVVFLLVIVFVVVF